MAWKITVKVPYKYSGQTICPYEIELGRNRTLIVEANDQIPFFILIVWSLAFIVPCQMEAFGMLIEVTAGSLSFEGRKSYSVKGNSHKQFSFRDS